MRSLNLIEYVYEFFFFVTIIKKKILRYKD